MGEDSTTYVEVDDLKIFLCGGVYRPSEDTYLLYDYLKEAGARGLRAVEIGSGTGAVSLLLARENWVLSVDLKPEAARCTWLNAKANGLDGQVDVLCCDSLSAVREGRLFDLVVFNPPYVPTDSVEAEDASWSGGRGGVEVASKFLRDSVARLKRGGEVVCVLSSLMDLGNLAEVVEEARLSFETLAEERFFLRIDISGKAMHEVQ